MTFWRSKTFRDLQKVWYERLSEDGFKDHEKLVGDEMALRQTAYKAYRGAEELEIETKSMYYSLLSERIISASFSSDVDRLILTWYAEGEKIKIICEELEKLGERRCRGTVRFTIRKYEMAWGMKEYTLKQLNRKI